MKSTDAFIAVVDALDTLQITYMVVGSLSYNVYGIPRSTQAADLVIDLGDRNIKAVAELLGSEFKLDPQMSFESVTVSARYVLEFIETQFKIELFLLRDEACHQARFARRQLVPIEDRQVWAARHTRVAWQNPGVDPRH